MPYPRDKVIWPLNNWDRMRLLSSPGHVPVNHTPCRVSFCVHSSLPVVCSPVSVLLSGDSVSVSCKSPVDLSSRSLASVPRSSFEDGWWQTCHPLGVPVVATKKTMGYFTILYLKLNI